MTLSETDFQAISRYRYLGGRRPNVGHITKNSHPDVLRWWAMFDAWSKWLDAGKKGPRPLVWRLVPRFAWQLRKEILAARPRRPPIPPTPPQPPLPPLPSKAAMYQNVIYLGSNPLLALNAKPHYKFAFTADGGTHDPSRAEADEARNHGHDVFVWYVPTQVSKERAEEVARRLGTTEIIGQAETLDEYRVSREHGRNVVIGNLSSCFEDETVVRELNSGLVVFVNEFYWNQAKYRRPDNHNLPVASLCVACYDGHSDGDPNAAWDPSMEDYIGAGYYWPSMSAYGPGMTENDYKLLP